MPMKQMLRPQRHLYDGLVVAASSSPESTVLVVEGKSYSYQELLDAALRLASAFRKRGVVRGDRIAIYMDNTWPCVVSIYATVLSGAVFIIINPQTKSDKLEYLLNDSEAKILMTDSHLSNVFMPIANRFKYLSGIITSGDYLEDYDSCAKKVEGFEDTINQAKPLVDKTEIIPNDLAALIYTSGSTGNPKGVMQTHQSMVFAAWSLIEYQRLSDRDRIMLVLPLAFDYGLYQLLMAVMLGGVLVVERSFNYPAQIYKRIEEEKATVFPAVPTIFAILIAAHKRNKLCFPSIKRVTNTAAALPADFIPDLKQIFPNALIFKMYGLTECKRVSYLEPEMLEKKPTSVGKAIPGTEIYLLTMDGEPVEPGEKGILYVRGPHIMRGYWKQPELSAHMLKEGQLPGEKVLCTQDWFRMDEDGYLYFIGRSDEIIKTRGEKVSPVEVENVLYGIQGIKEAAVVGVPDEIFGQSIRAYVSLDEDSKLTDREIKRYCMSKLENFMMPKEVIIKKELPKTNTGKISKKSLTDVE